MDTDITQLAKMMRKRRAAGVAPYTLLLGSSLSLTPAVRRAVCDNEDWEAFWETVSRTTPEEQFALLHEPLSQLGLKAGCDALAQLVGAGYFNVVLTLNVDDALDNALKTLPASEYHIWVHDVVKSQEIIRALDRSTPRIKVVKLRGDVNIHKLLLTLKATFEFPRDLEEAVTRFLRYDTVIVGDLPFDDAVHRCIKKGAGALWVIAAEGSDFLRQAKRIRKVGEVIAATEFNAFFTALAEELGLGGAEEAAPKVAFVPPEKRVNPYRGLKPFESNHAPYFFGRELLTEILVERLRQERFLAVVGASGSGKSSVVHAGVLPALANERLPTDATWPLPGSANWPAPVIKPGQHPQEALAAELASLVSAARGMSALDEARLQQVRQEIQDRLLREESALHELVMEMVAKHADDRRVVVVIDQFEELFTLCPFEQRQRFIDALLYAVGQPEGRTTVLLTLRADFVAQCTAYPALSDLIAGHQVWVRAMDDAGLRAAIERPAWLAGMRYEPGLVPLILADVGREPGALPLLEDALWSLFEHCRAGDEIIELEEYREIGGVQGALAKRADEVFAKLSKEEQECARRILLRLVETREDLEPTRRRATLDELITAPEERDPVEEVAERLTNARLLTRPPDEEMGRGLVEISHEALIRGWPRLREWIDEDRTGLRTHRRLTETAVEWERLKRDKSVLYRGARLVEVEEWVRAHPDDPNPLEREFLDASLALMRGEQRRQRLLTVGALVVALIFGLLAFYAFQQRDKAERKAAEAQSLALAASAQRALSDNNTDLAIALALEANNLDQPPPQSGITLADAAYFAPGTRRRFEGHTDDVTSVAFSPDGRIILSGSADDSLRLWDIESGREIGRFEGHTDDVTSVAFSLDGRTILSGSADDSLRLWDIESGREIRRFEGHTDDVTSVAFSPNGQTILSGSADTSLRLWDIGSGTGVHLFEGHTDEVLSVAFSSDGRQVASGSRDDELCVWDVDTGEKIRCIRPAATHGVKSVAFNPDNRTVMVGAGGFGPGIYLWDINTGGLIRTLAGHTGGDTQVDFSSDGRLAVSGSYDNSVILWLVDRVDREAEVQRFIGHSDDITSVAFSPDDRTILSGSADNSLRLWDVASGAEIRRFTGYIGMAVSPDGRTVVSSPDGNRLVLLDIETGEVTRRFDGDTGGVTSLAFSPDGRTVFSGSWDTTLRLWDIESGTEIRIFEGHPGGVTSIAISPDGRTALSGSYGPADPSDHDGWDRVLLLWDVKTGEIIHRFIGHSGIVRSVAFSSDGQTALSGSDDTSIRLWDIEGGTEIVRFEGHTDKVTSAVFGPDDRTVLSASRDQSLRLWDIVTGQEIRRFTGHTSAVTSVALRPDGRTLLSGSDDLSIRLWDIETGMQIGRFTGHGQQVRGVVFRPDGRTALSRSWDNTIRLWQIHLPDELIEWTYANRYVRELTCAERQQYGVEPFCDEKGGNLK